MQRRATKPKALVTAALLVLAVSVIGLVVAQSGASAATLRIGVVLDQTGPASALGAGEANTLDLLQGIVAGQGGLAGYNVEFVLLDSASTVAGAVEAVERLLEENQLHALVCCTLSSSSQAIVAPAQTANVPTISLAAAAPIARPAAQRRWIFQAAQSDALMVRGLVADLQARGVTDVTVMALSDEYGESGLLELQLALANVDVRLNTVVRYDRDAESYVAPALAAILDRPQAVVVWGIAEDSARMVRALRERQFGGDIYVSHGVGAPAFLELAGAAAEGVRMPMGPALVAAQLAANHPLKESALEFADAYAESFGADTLTSFAAHMYDAVRLIEQAVQYAASAGTLDPTDLVATRAAIRIGLEEMGPYFGAGGVFDYSGSDHAGLDERALVMVEVRDGSWALGR